MSYQAITSTHGIPELRYQCQRVGSRAAAILDGRGVEAGLDFWLQLASVVEGFGVVGERGEGVGRGEGGRGQGDCEEGFG